MPHRLLALAGICLFAWGCASGRGSAVRYETGARAAATADGLHRVRTYGSGALYVLPGAVLSGYSRFTVAPVEIFYRKPKPGDVVHEFQPRERERFERAVRHEFEAAFGADSALELAVAPGPGVLNVRAQFVDLSLGVPRPAAPDLINVWTTTEFRLFLDLSDSVTGESLLRTVDFRRLHPSSLGFPLASGGIAHPSATQVAAMEETAAIRQAVGNRARAFHDTFGRLRSMGIYFRGKKHGKWIEKATGRIPRAEGSYALGKREGVWWINEGYRRVRTKYVDGVIVKSWPSPFQTGNTPTKTPHK